jgi:hypothetical protein
MGHAAAAAAEDAGDQGKDRALVVRNQRGPRHPLPLLRAREGDLVELTGGAGRVGRGLERHHFAPFTQHPARGFQKSSFTFPGST